MEALLATFGEAFNELDTHSGNRPNAAYLQRLLGSDYFIALAALKSDEVVGGIVAYELKKFEQQRSEIYIYDLAVSAPYRRVGIATALISELKKIAAARAAYMIFVQADIGDEPAIALYTKLGVREDVLHLRSGYRRQWRCITRRFSRRPCLPLAPASPRLSLGVGWRPSSNTLGAWSKAYAGIDRPW